MSVCANGHVNEDNVKFCQECGNAVTGAAADSGRALHLNVSLEPPKQSRISVFFRFFFSIIPIIISAVIGVAVYFAVIGAWFSALFTGKVPEGIHRFVAQWVGYQARVSAYSNLVTAHHPGYSVTPRADNELTTSVAHGPMSRSAVFFRVILSVPAALLNVAGIFGMQLMVIVMWFCALLTTKTPRSLHQATAALLRYQTRYAAYYFLLTPDQPWHGLYGDSKDEAQEETGSAETAPLTQWRLTKGARRAVTASMILGVVLYIGFVTLMGVFMGNIVQYEYFCADAMGNLTSNLSLFPMQCDSGSGLYKLPIR